MLFNFETGFKESTKFTLEDFFGVQSERIQLIINIPTYLYNSSDNRDFNWKSIPILCIANNFGGDKGESQIYDPSTNLRYNYSYENGLFLKGEGNLLKIDDSKKYFYSGRVYEILEFLKR
ncbi:MAG: hypothetical protein PF569_04840 [Candidatus Woesearchaeota archaeon]|jgi:hypothetical protein|nr:hypothetical protein [Candidatus Woesearchaeota archaeon]